MVSPLLPISIQRNEIYALRLTTRLPPPDAKNRRWAAGGAPDDAMPEDHCRGLLLAEIEINLYCGSLSQLFSPVINSLTGLFLVDRLHDGLPYFVVRLLLLRDYRRD